MRDPARIDRMIELLRLVWKRYPDLRLGQLVVNLCRDGDAFQQEDAVTEVRLREWAHD